MSETAANELLPLTVTPAAAQRGAEDGVWDVSWRVSNLTRDPIQISETWLPHGRFRGEREVVSPPVAIPAGKSIVLRRFVRCPAKPGETVENAFLILEAGTSGGPLRFFSRLRIECKAADVLHLLVERETAQPVQPLRHES